jgi:sulfur-carrier protein adenylyltransferase/sulfurtransferase
MQDLRRCCKGHLLIMFILQEQPINTTQARESISNTLDGALVSFEGVVRNDKTLTTETSSLLYIADEEECKTIGDQIIREALGLFPVNHILCIQRIGHVKVGETSIWIGVWSAHRDEAFKANRYIIEEIKKRLLIWKKEYYADGSNKWIHGSETPVIL